MLQDVFAFMDAHPRYLPSDESLIPEEEPEIIEGVA